MVRAVVVGDRIRVSTITESPVELSVNSSEFWKSERITSFERFLSFENVGVGDKRSSIG